VIIIRINIMKSWRRHLREEIPPASSADAAFLHKGRIFARGRLIGRKLLAEPRVSLKSRYARLSINPYLPWLLEFREYIKIPFRVTLREYIKIPFQVTLLKVFSSLLKELSLKEATIHEPFVSIFSFALFHAEY